MSANSFKHRSSKLSSRLTAVMGVVWGSFFSKRKKLSIRNLDERLVYSLSGSRIPNFRQLGYIGKYLTRRERLAFNLSLSVLALAIIVLAGRFYFKHLEVVPIQGGEYVEGVVGIPKYVNPLYSSINDVDSDLVSLVYSSLYKHDAHGALVGDLVESSNVSDDGKTYTFKIFPTAHWNDGTPLTTGDVLFTFNAIKDQAYKSPLRMSFSGVDAEAIDDQTIQFKLKEAYAGFPELLTFGIMPQSQWGQLAPTAVSLADLNLKPIGSGPYQFKSLIRDRSGNLKAYNLTVNSNYYGKKPFVKEISFRFYPSYEEALADLNSNVIDGLGYFPVQESSAGADKSYINYHSLATPQVKGIFLNVKVPNLQDVAVRQALSLALDKAGLMHAVMPNKASLVDAPILPNNILYSSNYQKYGFDQGQAQKLIESAGWKLVDITPDDLATAEKNKNSLDPKLKKEAEQYSTLGLGKWYYRKGEYLIIKLSTVNAGENPQLATLIRNSWEAIHVKTLAELVPPAQIQGDVIKTRDYEAILSGEVLTGDADPYPFWHSSQIGADGLNLSDYASKETDKLLEQARQMIDQTARKKLYQQFLAKIAADEPAIFLYSPNYVYAVNSRIKNLNTDAIVSASDRFADVNQWYIETGRRFKK